MYHHSNYTFRKMDPQDPHSSWKFINNKKSSKYYRNFSFMFANLMREYNDEI